MKHPAALLRHLALVGAGVLAGLLLAEGALRLVRSPLTRINRRPAVYQPDPLLGFSYIPNSRDYIERLEFRQPVRINSAGFFDDEFTLTPPPGVTRIAVIGDSFAVGWQVGKGQNFPDVLERNLNQSDAPACPCEVLNFGLSGTGTVQQALIFEHTALNYQPDIVLVAFYYNDVRDVALGTVRQEVYRDYVLTYRDEAQRAELTRQVDAMLSGGGWALRFAIQRSYVARALYNTWLQRQGNPSPNLRDNRIFASLEPLYSQREAEAQIVGAVERMDRACRQAGCELVFVAIPSRGEVERTRDPAYRPIARALNAEGVRTLALLKPFRKHAAQGEQLYWQYDAHANQAGYRLIANEIAGYLQREGLLGD